MGWKEDQVVKRVLLPLETLLAKEQHWSPSPVTERDRWIKDYGECNYDLIGEWDVDDDLTLLRFQWRRSDAELLEWQAPGHGNVLLSKKMPPFKPTDMTFRK